MIRRLVTLAVVSVAVASTSGCRVPGQGIARPARLPAGVTAGGTLRIATTAPSGLDPIDAYEPVSQLLAPLVCEPLVAIDPVTGELRGGAAKRVQVSADGRTVTVELHGDTPRHDGGRLDAEDVRVSLTRLASPAGGSRLRALLVDVAGFDRLAEDLVGDGDRPLQGVRVLEPKSLQITLTAPVGEAFLHVLAHPAAAPVSRARLAADPRAARRRPSCAGPYRIVDDGGSEGTIVLERFGPYRPRNQAVLGGGTLPDRIEVLVAADTAAALAAFRDGRVDLVQVPEGALSSVGPLAGDLVSGDAPTVELLGLPAGTSGPYADPAARRALALALDRERIATVVFASARTVATGFFPPALGPYHRAGACLSLPSRADTERARATMPAAALAALRSGPVRLSVNADGPYEAMAREIASQWHDVFGLDVVVEGAPWGDYVRTATTGLGFDHPFRLSWGGLAAEPVPTTLDPSTFVQPLFDAGQIGTGNWARWSSRPFDELYRNDVRTAVGTTSRVEWFHRLEDLLCAQLPVIPLANGRSHWLLRREWRPARASALDLAGRPLVRELHR